MFYLPTYEEALEITQKCEAFYVTYTKVDDFEVAMFDYRLASYNDFKIHNGFELRGLTFINNNGVWTRHLGLHKFFNVNQVEDWQESILKNYEISSVRNKEDGSMIMTPVFPNDKIIAKTKMSFISSQAIAAQKIIDENVNYQTLIKHLNNNLNIEPIFEYVSPHNQIVLQYENSQLVLLQARYKDSGEYVDIYTLNSFSSMFKVPMAAHLHRDKNLEELLVMKEVLTDIEGFVVTFNNGIMAKVKTTWYMQRHGLLSEDNIKENVLIRTILGLSNEDGTKNAEIDDILGALSLESEKRIFIVNTMEKINNYFNHNSNVIRNYIMNVYVTNNEFKTNKKSFYEKIQNDIKSEVFDDEIGKLILFLVKVSIYELETEIENSLKKHIAKKTFRLNQAKEFLLKI